MEIKLSSLSVCCSSFQLLASGVIVKMAKETCAEGLIVSGGKEGIFIKEVRPESPASKLLSVHEGDQILSATVYFDDVTYEDALQILEHAQPYKMELLLKRKPIKTSTLESEPALEIIQVTITMLFFWICRVVLKLISLDKTLKTTDITVALADQESPSTKKSPEGKTKKKENKERSELKFTFKGNEKKDKHKQNIPVKVSLKNLKTPRTDMITSDLSAHDNTLLSPTVVSHTELEECQLPIDINTQVIINESSGKTLPSTDKEMSTPKVKDESNALHLEIKMSEAEIKLSKVPDSEYSTIKTHVTDLQTPTIRTLSSETMPEVPSSDIEEAVMGIDVQSVDVGRGDIQIPDVEAEVPSVEVEIPETVYKDIDVKMKKRQMSFPKFGVKAPGIDVGVLKPDISPPEGNMEVKLPEVEIEVPKLQVEVKDTRFKIPTLKFPKFGAVAPIVTVELPDVDKDIKLHGTESPEPKLSISGKVHEVDFEKQSDFKKSSVKIPSIDVDVKTKGLELEGQGSKFKLPNQGISLTKVKGPEIDLGVSKKDIDVTLPETNMEIQPPDAELKVSSGEVEMSERAATEIDVKVKKTRISFPGLGFSKPEVCEVDVSLPKVNISLPQGNVGVKKSEVEMTAPEIQVEMKHDIELEGQGSKFKLPKFGISMPKVKGPEIDLGLSKKVIDVTLPEDKVEVQPTDVEIEVPSGQVQMPEGAATEIDVKMKKPRMSFGWFSKPEVKAPEVDVSLPKGDISLPEVKVEVKESEVEIKSPEIQVEMKHGIELEGQGSKFKLPKFGISLPKVKGPEFDLKLKLTMSAMNIENPSVDLKGPSIDVDVKSKTLEIVTLPEASVEVQPPRIELKVSSGEVEMPEGPRMSFGWFSKPEVKASEVDVSLPEVDISLPEGKVEVKEPEVEMTAPEIQVEVKHDIELEGQGSKFKLPKFGISLPKVKGPEFDLSISKTDVDVNLPERRADHLPDVEVGVPSVEVEIPEAVSKDIDVKLKKPRMSFPKFGFSKPEVKAPEVDVSLPGVDISLPEERVEVKDTVGSPSRFKMPTLKFPQFGAAAPNITVEVPDVDKDVKVHGSEIPELKLTMSAMNIEKPSVDLKGPSIDVDVKSKRLDIVTLPEASVEVQPPSTELKVPSGKASEVDVSLPKGDISLPEVKVEVKESEVEIKSPEIQVEMKHGIELEEQGSKFKLPKFGISLPKVKGPEFDLSISKTDVDVNLPERRADHLPDVEVGVPSVEVEIPEAVSKDIDVKLKKPRMSFPKFGFSKPEVKAPEVDVSLPGVDISLPEERVERRADHLPDVEVGVPSVEVEIPEAVSKDIDVKLKKPRMSFPKFGFSKPEVKAPEVDVSLPGVDISLPEEKGGGQRA
uniref:PDZ domain-containing protein n=1 Tax=Oncorhynchus tshawytscha TaxID=74940 RepID=A0AAZ3RV93_ONCTS